MRVIFAGTGLSMEMVNKTVSSQAAKSMGSHTYPIVSVDFGRFTKDGTSHVDSIGLRAASPIGGWRIEYCIGFLDGEYGTM